MPVVIARPDATLQLGTFTVTGAASGHAALSDELDTSYVANTVRARLDSQVLKLSLTNIALPAGAKIFSVRPRVRVERVTGFTTQPQIQLLFVQKLVQLTLTGVAETLLRKLISAFLIPRAATVGWQTQEEPARLSDAFGREWTQTSFNDFELHTAREFAGPNAKIAGIWVDVTYNERPVGTAVAPTGTVVDTTRPLVTWIYADPEGDRQQRFNVRLFSQAQWTAPNFDPLTSLAFTESGWVFGEDLSWTVSRDLVNGAWRAYIQVEQVWSGIGEHRSVQTFAAWTQNVPGPPKPLISAVFDAENNRVQIALARGGTTPGTDAYDVERSDDAGLTWDVIRGGRQIEPDAAGAAAIDDYEAPLGQLAQYRVQAFRELGAVKVASDFSDTASVVPTSRDYWLKHPTNPTLNTRLPVAVDEPFRTRSQGVFAPLTKDGLPARKIVVNGPRYGVEGRLELTYDDSTDPDGLLYERFDALHDTGEDLLFQHPDRRQHYVGLGAQLDESYRLDEHQEIYWRRLKVSYTEVRKP